MALEREVAEELRLRIEDKKFMFKISNADRDEYHYWITQYTGTPELGGPEKERMNDQNQYYLEWIDLSKIKELNNLYPSEVIERILKFGY